MMLTTQEYYLTTKLENQVFFAYSSVSHCLTPHAHLLHTKKPYASHNRVCVANGPSLEFQCVSFSLVASKSNFGISLTLNDILYVPFIIRNLLFVSKLSKYN